MKHETHWHALGKIADVKRSAAQANVNEALEKCQEVERRLAELDQTVKQLGQQAIENTKKIQDDADNGTMTKRRIQEFRRRSIALVLETRHAKAEITEKRVEQTNLQEELREAQLVLFETEKKCEKFRFLTKHEEGVRNRTLSAIETADHEMNYGTVSHQSGQKQSKSIDANVGGNL